MRFVKSNVAKKLVIVLIVLMIFNIIMPKSSKAWDLMGILNKPIYALATGVALNVDAHIGLLLNGGVSLGFEAGGIFCDWLSGCFSKDGVSEELKGEASTWVSKVFVGPDSIFSGKVRLFNANIFKVEDLKEMSSDENKDEENDLNEETVKEKVKNLVDNAGDFNDNASTVTSNGYYLLVRLKQIISKIYVIMRNICATIMLAGLIYTGIKILLYSNIPGKKGEWLKYLQDWCIGLILLVFSHIILIGVLEISDKLVESLSTGMWGFGGVNWQLAYGSLKSWDSTEQIIYIIMLWYMIYLVIVYGIAYFRRLMWICILIVFAPIVSVMYAFGGQTKQIYSKWFREYVTIVLVQPFHMIVYYILVAIPLGLASDNGIGFLNSFDLIYALVAISFIRPAERYVRNLFGMDSGLVTKASYDSGKEVVRSVEKTAAKVAQVAVKIGRAVATGGGSIVEDVSKSTSSQEQNANSIETQKKLLSDYDEGFGTDEWDPQERDQMARDIRKEELNSEEYEDSDENKLAKLKEAKDYYNEEAESALKYDDMDSYQMFSSLAKDTQKDIDKLEEKNKTKEDLNGLNLQISNANVNIENGTNNLKDKENSNEEKNKGNSENPDNESQLDKEKDKQQQTFEGISSLLIDKDASKLIDSTFGEDKKVKMFVGAASEIGQALYEGYNEIMDGMYVGEAPKDWKQRSDRWNEYNQESLKAIKTEFVEDPNHIEFIIKEHKLIEKYRDKYPDKSESRIREYAEEDAKKKLQDMSGYMDKGVAPNIKVLNTLYGDQKKYGLTLDEAIKKSKEFSKFNSDIKNVQSINATYKTSASTVQEIIPEAKDYYYGHGFKNIDDIKNTDFLKEKFKIDKDYAANLTKIISVHAKNGKPIIYNGSNEKEKNMIDEINKAFMGTGNVNG